jgi:hypothetical protein
MNEMGVLTIGTQTDQVGYIAFCWYQIVYTIDQVQFIYRQRGDLLPQSREFLTRLEKEFLHFLPYPDRDMRLSIYFNPIATKLLPR